MDTLLYSVLRGEPDHLHLKSDRISCDGRYLSPPHLLGLTNPVAPVLSLLVIVRVEVQVVQYHLESDFYTTYKYVRGNSLPEVLHNNSDLIKLPVLFDQKRDVWPVGCSSSFFLGTPYWLGPQDIEGLNSRC